VSATILALDTASREVSVAVASADALLALRTGPQRGSSAHLVTWIDECLAEAGVALDQLAGVVALRGPGSFTGLRVGLATVLGFHQALGIAATALPTLGVLAAAMEPGARVLALVPAGAGDWFAQPWSSTWPPSALGEPQRLPAAALGAIDAELAVVGSDEDAAALATLAPPVRVAGPLAPVAARLAAGMAPAWDADLLRSPLYLAPAPVTVPGPPKRLLPASGDRPQR
jgi:tRNA threonylcarbamoyl adenosine modification protein YeaZ